MAVHVFSGVDDVPIHADIVGEGGQVVLFLHGGGQTRHSWRGAADAIAASGRRAVAMDLRGHGDSGWSVDGAYNIDLLAGDVWRVVAQLGVRPVIIGASVGGNTALTAVGEGPEDMASALVLVDIAPHINPEGAGRIRAFMGANPDGFESVEDAAAAVASYRPDRPKPPSIEGLRRNLRFDAETGRFHWHWDPDFIRSPDLNHMVMQEPLERAARRVKVPTLLVRGAMSDLVANDSVDHFLELVPHAECADVAGASHMVVGDMNDEFNAQIIGFLDRSIPSFVR